MTAAIPLDAPGAPELRLRADWNMADQAITLRLLHEGGPAIEGARLALTSLFRIHPDCRIEGGELVRQLSNFHLIAQPQGARLEPGQSWTVRADRLSHVLRHFTYGPKSAFLMLADDAVVPVAVEPMTVDGVAGAPNWPAAPTGPMPPDEAPVAIVPAPLEIQISGKADIHLPLVLAGGVAQEAQDAFSAVADLAARLFPQTAPLLAQGGEGRPVECALAATEAEGYSIRFADGRVLLSAGDGAGFRHGFITLAQMLRGARESEDLVFPSNGTIHDRPRFGWRGMHLDVARQFYEVGDLLDLLDCLAWNKLNRFHLHLNDDEGWRLDIPAYPELVAKAAWRGIGELLPPLLGSGPERSGGFYSGYDIGRLVAHAERLGIEIVPEIDIPGHCHCVLEALPQLRDPAETGIYRSVQYFPNNALNPAMEETWTLLGAVFDRLMELFPASYIHAGADEVAEGAWMGSPKARALSRDLFGREDTFALQSWFLKKVQAMLRERGRNTAVWEEAALGGGLDTEGSLLMAWKESKSGRALAEKGYDVVLAPAEACYLDMALCADWLAPGASWAGTVRLEDAYRYEPGSDWPERTRDRLKGVQACLWSENMALAGLFSYLVYPRLSAVAEVAWSAPGRRNYARFCALHPLMPRSAKR